MGHNTLLVIPRNVRWRRVVALVGDGAASADVFAASAEAAEKKLLAAADDPVFVEALRLLLAIPAAARTDNFGDQLRQADLSVGQDPELLDLVVAVGGRLDAIGRGTIHRSDLGDFAGRAVTAALTHHITERVPGLFETSPDDVRTAAKGLSSSKGIATLTRTFFSSLTETSLSYWLERVLADHSGPGGRFAAPGSRDAFDAELSAYAYESTRIIKEFSGGWFGKTLYDHGAIRSQDVARFGAVCLSKIVKELRLRRADDA